MKRISIIVGSGLLLWSSQSHAATFRAKAEGHSIIIYSTSPIPDRCSVSVPFTFLKDGTRHEAKHGCQKYTVAVGKDLELCKVTMAELVDPRVEGPVAGTCQSGQEVQDVPK